MWDLIVSVPDHCLSFYFTYILINFERVSKHSGIILGLRAVTTCWSWAGTNRTSPSNGVGLGSPLAACSVYGDLTCSVHTVNNFVCSIVNDMPTIVIEDNMLDWHICQICYPLEIKLLLLLLQILVGRCEICVFIFYLRLWSSLYSQIMRLDITYRIGNQSINQSVKSINQSINQLVSQSGPVRSGPARPGPVRFGSVQSSPVQSSPGVYHHIS